MAFWMLFAHVEMPFLKGRSDAFEILPNQRYDRMFELMDCHGEYVERPENLSENAQASLRTIRWIMAILIQASLVTGLIS
jgi:hypothetical protein